MGKASTGIALIIGFLSLTAVVQAEPLVYTLEKGDTLYSLAKKYNVPLSVLMKYNQIEDPTD